VLGVVAGLEPVADGLALGHQRADTGGGIEGRDARAAGADAFGQCALRVELDLELFLEELARKLVVLADVARDHLADLLGGQQQPEPPIVDAGVVGDAGDVLHAGITERDDELLGDAAQPEPADHDGAPVVDNALIHEPAERGRGCVVELLLHALMVPS